MYEDWNWTVGEVVAPFGRMGEARVRIESDFPDRFTRLQQVCLRPPRGQPALFEVERARLHKGQVILKLKGIESIDDVERWRNALVQIPRAEAMPLEPDSYYVSDLIGAEVVTRENRVLGKLENVLSSPAHDLLQIGEILIPAVKEFVISVDVQARRIVVAPPAGLLPDEELETQEE
ncbi:MAG TPA: ribosome maturation factor RimM [Chthonomonadales bacterium]|nr:ribosome maturation factor RimM [Chthonomonadales bacterium]